MTERKEYVPMPDANTDRVRTAATLPFHLEQQIGLNIGRIETLLQIGGIANLKISSDHQGERSQVVGQIVGTGFDGSAVAGKFLCETVETVENKFAYNGSIIKAKAARWADMEIILNIPEMTQKILYQDKKVNDAKNWVTELNRALRDSIRKEGIKHLVTVPDDWFMREEKRWIIPIKVINIPLSVFLFSLHDSTYPIRDIGFRALGGFLLSFPTIWNFFTETYVLCGPEKKSSGRRLSLFSLYEVDRALVLQCVSRTKPLVKALS